MNAVINLYIFTVLEVSGIEITPYDQETVEPKEISIDVETMTVHKKQISLMIDAQEDKPQFEEADSQQETLLPTSISPDNIDHVDVSQADISLPSVAHAQPQVGEKEELVSDVGIIPIEVSQMSPGEVEVNMTSAAVEQPTDTLVNTQVTELHHEIISDTIITQPSEDVAPREVTLEVTSADVAYPTITETEELHTLDRGEIVSEYSPDDQSEDLSPQVIELDISTAVTTSPDETNTLEIELDSKTETITELSRSIPDDETVKPAEITTDISRANVLTSTTRIGMQEVDIPTESVTEEHICSTVEEPSAQDVDDNLTKTQSISSTLVQTDIQETGPAMESSTAYFDVQASESLTPLEIVIDVKNADISQESLICEPIPRESTENISIDQSEASKKSPDSEHEMSPEVFSDGITIQLQEKPLPQDITMNLAEYSTVTEATKQIEKQTTVEEVTLEQESPIMYESKPNFQTVTEIVLPTDTVSEDTGVCISADNIQLETIEVPVETSTTDIITVAAQCDYQDIDMTSDILTEEIVLEPLQMASTKDNPLDVHTSKVDVPLVAQTDFQEMQPDTETVTEHVIICPDEPLVPKEMVIEIPKAVVDQQKELFTQQQETTPEGSVTDELDIELSHQTFVKEVAVDVYKADLDISAVSQVPEMEHKDTIETIESTINQPFGEHITPIETPLEVVDSILEMPKRTQVEEQEAEIKDETYSESVVLPSSETTPFHTIETSVSHVSVGQGTEVFVRPLQDTLTTDEPQVDIISVSSEVVSPIIIEREITMGEVSSVEIQSEQLLPEDDKSPQVSTFDINISGITESKPEVKFEVSDISIVIQEDTEQDIVQIDDFEEDEETQVDEYETTEINVRTELLKRADDLASEIVDRSISEISFTLAQDAEREEVYEFTGPIITELTSDEVLNETDDLCEPVIIEEPTEDVPDFPDIEVTSNMIEPIEEDVPHESDMVEMQPFGSFEAKEDTIQETLRDIAHQLPEEIVCVIDDYSELKPDESPEVLEIQLESDITEETIEEIVVEVEEKTDKHIDAFTTVQEEVVSTEISEVTLDISEPTPQITEIQMAPYVSQEITEETVGDITEKDTEQVEPVADIYPEMKEPRETVEITLEVPEETSEIQTFEVQLSPDVTELTTEEIHAEVVEDTTEQIVEDVSIVDEELKTSEITFEVTDDTPQITEIKMAPVVTEEVIEETLRDIAHQQPEETEYVIDDYSELKPQESPEILEIQLTSGISEETIEEIVVEVEEKTDKNIDEFTTVEEEVESTEISEVSLDISETTPQITEIQTTPHVSEEITGETVGDITEKDTKQIEPVTDIYPEMKEPRETVEIILEGPEETSEIQTFEVQLSSNVTTEEIHAEEVEDTTEEIVEDVSIVDDELKTSEITFEVTDDTPQITEIKMAPVVTEEVIEETLRDIAHQQPEETEYVIDDYSELKPEESPEVLEIQLTSGITEETIEEIVVEVEEKTDKHIDELTTVEEEVESTEISEVTLNISETTPQITAIQMAPYVSEEITEGTVGDITEKDTEQIEPVTDIYPEMKEPRETVEIIPEGPEETSEIQTFEVQLSSDVTTEEIHAEEVEDTTEEIVEDFSIVDEELKSSKITFEVVDDTPEIIEVIDSETEELIPETIERVTEIFPEIKPDQEEPAEMETFQIHFSSDVTTDESLEEEGKDSTEHVIESVMIVDERTSEIGIPVEIQNITSEIITETPTDISLGNEEIEYISEQPTELIEQSPEMPEEHGVKTEGTHNILGETCTE